MVFCTAALLYEARKGAGDCGAMWALTDDTRARAERMYVVGENMTILTDFLCGFLKTIL